MPQSNDRFITRGLSLIIVVVVLSGCHAAGIVSTNSRTTNGILGGRTFRWPGTGLIFSLPDGWRRHDNNEEDERSWVGPGSLNFSVRVSVAKPEWGNEPLEKQTEKFFEDHKKGGEEDLRYLVIDGVRGVHYLRDENGFDDNYRRQDQKIIIWDALRMHKGQGQVIFARLTSPSGNFSKQRETLYQLLQSIKFTQNDSGDSANTAGTIDDSLVAVSIPADGEFYLGKHRIARAEITTEVDKLLRDRPEEKQIIYVKAGPEINYGTIVSLIDDIGSVGYQRVGLMTSKSNESAFKAISKGEARTKENIRSTSNARPAGTDQELLDVTVEATKAGAPIIDIGGTTVSLNELAKNVRAILIGRTSKAVRIVAPSTIHYKMIVAVIDELKAGGAEPIGFAIKSP